MASEPGKLEWSEILLLFPEVASLSMDITAAVKKAQEDGVVSAKEVGDLIGSVSGRIGALIDKAIAEAND